MSTLSALMKKRNDRLATAFPATFATDGRVEGGKIAKVAGKAVANPENRKTAPAPKVSPGVTAVWWRIRYGNGELLEAAFTPPATFEEVIAWYPGAIDAEPFEPTVRPPEEPLSMEDEAAVRRWLTEIGETDEAMVAEVIEQCQRDADAREYFTGRAAAELPKPDPFPDDRRTCDQCANLIARRCQAAKRGEIVASRNYEPIRDLPRRCEGYAPGAADADRRPGRERWPGLIQKGGE
jgi:hypothetical protein